MRKIDKHLNKIVCVIIALSLSICNIDVAYAFDLSKEAVLIENGSGEYEITGIARDTDNEILISGGDIVLKLNNVDISSNWYKIPIRLTNGAKVRLELIGDNVILGDNGIIVDTGCQLTIAGNGVLYVKADSSSAIGSEMYSTNGTGDIIIESGKITAISEFGAAIGSGFGCSETSHNGSILIKGGDIIAISKGDSAGIGSGAHNDIESITVCGDSKVYAESSRGGAGIGYGAEISRNGTISIDTTEDEDGQLHETWNYGDSDSLLGGITIKDNAVVTASSYSGSGVGLGTQSIGSQAYSVNIDILGNADVNSFSYKGEAVGKGCLLAENNKVVKPEELVTAFSVRSAPMVNNAAVVINGTTKLKLGSASNKAIDTQSLKTDGALLNAKILRETEECTDDIKIKGSSKDINIPSNCVSYVENIEAGSYSSEAINKIDDITTNKDNNIVEVNGVTETEITIRENKDRLNKIYVSESGSDDNSGLSSELPVKTFNTAYERVNNSGKIIVCNGKVRVNKVPKLGKEVTVTSKDDNIDYKGRGSNLTIDKYKTNFEDLIKVEDTVINVNGQLNEKNMLIRRVEIIDRSDKTLGLTGFKRANAVGVNVVDREFVGFSAGAFNKSLSLQNQL